MKTCQKTKVSFLTLNEKENFTKIVILFHGYGSNYQDFASFIDSFSCDVKDTLFIVPNGLAKLEVDDSDISRQWFSLLKRDEESIKTGVLSIKEEIESFIGERLRQYNLSNKKLILGGFSQGAMLASYLALRMASKPAGLCLFSGCLIGGFDDLDKESLKDLSVLITHGDRDEVIPISAALLAEEECLKNKVKVKLVIGNDVEHFVHNGAVSAFKSFISGL